MQYKNQLKLYILAGNIFHYQSISLTTYVLTNQLPIVLLWLVSNVHKYSDVFKWLCWLLNVNYQMAGYRVCMHACACVANAMWSHYATFLHFTSKALGMLEYLCSTFLSHQLWCNFLSVLKLSSGMWITASLHVVVLCNFYWYVVVTYDKCYYHDNDY